MKQRIFFILFVTGTILIRIPIYAQTTGAKLTLKLAVETAIANNADVLQADIQSKVDEIYWKQSKLNRYPSLNGTMSHGVNQGRSIDPFTNAYINQNVNYSSYGLNSGVVLFNGLSMQQAVKQTGFAYEASKMDWQQAKDNLTIGIILAYLQVLSNEDQLVQANNQATLSKSQVDRLDILNKEGAIAPSQLFDLQGQYANDQLLILNTQNALETSKLLLSRLMNVPYDRNMQLERLDMAAFATKYGQTPEQVYQTALQEFSLVKAVELRKQSAESGVRVAKGIMFPTLSLNANVNTNYSDAARSDVFLNTTEVVSDDYVLVNGSPSSVVYKKDNYGLQKIGYSTQLNNNLFTNVSLNLRVPIFNSFQSRNRVKLAKLSLKSNELEVTTTKTQLQQNIEQAYINMNTALDRHKVLLEQINAFTESYRAAEIRFNAGLGTSVDYLTAKNNLDRANINLIMAKYDYVLRGKVLDYYQGKVLW